MTDNGKGHKNLIDKATKLGYGPFPRKDNRGPEELLKAHEHYNHESRINPTQDFRLKD